MFNHANVALRHLPEVKIHKFQRLTMLNQQSGVVLLVCLIMLLLLTLIGISGTQNTSLQEKMAGNMRDRNLAFQAAEAALKAGEADILLAAYNCTNGRYLEMDANCDGNKDATAVWDSIDWSGSANPVKSVEYSGGTLAGLAANPRYIIEYLGCEPTPCTGAGVTYNFRVTARATGGSTSALVMLQSNVQSINAPP